ncbi:MAG: alpha-glucosidase, partial [Chitinophagaceae bacterium]|nr:alpha-glucosidase [Chitinophagaceae bacterium]
SFLKPLTMRIKDGFHLAFHEANLTDYAGMTLKLGGKDYLLTSGLVGSDRLGHKVKRSLPFVTPWRTIQIADKATQLLESRLIENLNEPNKIGDVSWFKPKKYVGIWWEMHLNKSTWDYASGKHGATTANAKRYIDFASQNGLTGVLVEGWNTGWEHWVGFDDREGVFDFVTPYPDYDLKEVVRYGKEKGVELIMHNETSAAPRTYEKQLDTAYKMMKSLGIHSVKTGYVGPVIPKGEYHDGQWMVNHYQKVTNKGAEYQVAIDVHEPIKPTGLRRTYPNLVSAEGARGQEFNAWSSDGGNPPEHLSIIAFTRMLAGPFDFTPGIFELSLPTKENNQVNTTLAQQLALYVVIYSPVQMAADLPENYVNQPAFQFIRDVGVDWEQTVVLNGEVGDFVTIAREEKATGNWFVGGITDENQREMTVDFNFLQEGKKYQASIYKDGKKAHYKNNPTDIEIEQLVVDKHTTKAFKLAAGGGFAVSLRRIK